ncbi:tetratricopeptide repeat protein [Ramlibacter albus]|uniref:Sel1 repeat family protein n=1 Tax=Ramlibacter albus TaxID=2079448 RepID=A0A923MD90_9BURK|nr:sel1 repeat family protein [Ramlibacter albus]MBC5768612.1 sel1 repeat family protein [Ramlibacter albus]
MGEFEKRLSQVRAEMERGEFKRASRLLAPLVRDGVPEALFLYSTFSIAGSESDAEFEKRSLELLTRSAQAGYPPALYALGACYDAGDLVERDTYRAAALFKEAADRGHAKAMFLHGLNLMAAINGMPSLPVDGLELVKSAARAGDDDAVQFLADRGIRA